eukprot:scaffold871_cov130-Cylindrotheca_fusiformis.AAC.32
MPQNEAKRKARKETKVVQRTARDILCGRGVPILNYHGNIRLHNIIDSYRAMYLNAERKSKPRLVTEIVNEIKAGGARFLKRSKDDLHSWVEVDDSYAHEKVSHALRCKKAAAKTKSLATRASLTPMASGSAGSRVPDSISSGTNLGFLPWEQNRFPHPGVPFPAVVNSNAISSSLSLQRPMLPQQAQYSPLNAIPSLDSYRLGTNAMPQLSPSNNLALLSMRNALPYSQNSSLYPIGPQIPPAAGQTHMQRWTNMNNEAYMSALIHRQLLSSERPAIDTNMAAGLRDDLPVPRSPVPSDSNVAARLPSSGAMNASPNSKNLPSSEKLAKSSTNTAEDGLVHRKPPPASFKKPARGNPKSDQS